LIIHVNEFTEQGKEEDKQGRSYDLKNEKGSLLLLYQVSIQEKTYNYT